MNLNFKIKEQKLIRIDTKTVAENSANFLYAVFDFDESWDGFSKKAVFQCGGRAYGQLLTDNTCTVPYEVISAGSFYVSLVGVDGNENVRITSSRVKIDVAQGPVLDAENTSEPTLTELEQLSSAINTARHDLDTIKNKVDGLVLGGGEMKPEDIRSAIDEYLSENPITAEEKDPTVSDWAKQESKPSYTAEEIGADEKGKAESLLKKHDASMTSHNDIRLAIQPLLRNDAGYITGAELETSVDNVLARAKISGEFDGKDGYTPVKGIDYFDGKDGTIQVEPLFAESIDWLKVNGDTSKVYILPDNFIYAYFEKANTQAYTNLLPLADTDTQFSGDVTATKYTGYFGGVRLNSSGAMALQSGSYVTGFIPYTYQGANNHIRVKNMGWCSSSNTQGVWFYDSEYKLLGILGYGVSGLTGFDECIAGSGNGVSGKTFSKESDGQYMITFDPSELSDVVNGKLDLSNTAYVRIFSGDFSNAIITINEEIVDGGSTGGYDWYSTGHSFVPADYEDRILELEDETAESKAKLDTHDLRLKDLENIGAGGEDYSIPSYWKDAIAEVETKIKALQDEGGADCVQFVWVSDTHCSEGSGASGNYSTAKNVGRLANKLMNDLNIPFLVVTGDLTADVGNTSTYPDNTDIDVFFDEIVKPVGKERVLSVLGNHDGVTYRTEGDLNISKATRFNWFMRPFCEDFKRVWGGGEYYYVDNTQGKTRFICLCSSNGLSDIYRTACYDAEQLKWLAEEALNVPDGYTVVVATHFPLCLEDDSDADENGVLDNVGYVTNHDAASAILTAFNNKTNYNGTVNNVTISKDYTNSTGVMCAVFAGHIHMDLINTELFEFPVIVIDSAGNKSENAKSFTNNSNAETCFDVVTINKATRTIYMTRLGVGEDRSTTY